VAVIINNNTVNECKQVVIHELAQRLTKRQRPAHNGLEDASFIDQYSGLLCRHINTIHGEEMSYV
jgi:hypothetical protein